MSKVEKLIEEYKYKVELLDKALNSIAPKISKARVDGDDYVYLLNERRVINDKRQIYYQFIKDLEDICTA